MTLQQVTLALVQAEVFKRSGTANSHSACSAIYVNICEIIMNWFEQTACTFVHDAANSLANAIAEESQNKQQMYSASFTPIKHQLVNTRFPRFP